MQELDKDELVFYNECLKFLDYFQVDYKVNPIMLGSGGNSVILNPESIFYKAFGGKSINSVAEYVARVQEKKTQWKQE